MPLRRFIPAAGICGATARIVASCAVLLIGAALGPRPAAAQSIVAFVNGQPITALDVDQRARIMEAFNRQKPTRKDVIEDLVDEKVKLRQATRLGIEITDTQVERAFAGMARNSSRSTSELTNALRQAGIDPRAFQAKLRADLAWREILQQMSPGTFQVRDADVVAALVARGQQLSAKAMQYTLQQIVFVVPRGSPASVTAARMREAEALRAKFSDCQGDLALAREYSEVVVKERVIRISTDLPTRLQQLLEKTPDGRMTPPESTAAGIEVVAVCARKETVADLGSRREIRDQLLSSRVETQEKQILEKLRRQAIIEYK
ncbi:MAG: SurA N-terminal domain-containing protein [Xanthobacteraceae bacterium]